MVKTLAGHRVGPGPTRRSRPRSVESPPRNYATISSSSSQCKKRCAAAWACSGVFARSIACSTSSRWSTPGRASCSRQKPAASSRLRITRPSTRRSSEVKLNSITDMTPITHDPSNRPSPARFLPPHQEPSSPPFFTGCSSSRRLPASWFGLADDLTDDRPIQFSASALRRRIEELAGELSAAHRKAKLGRKRKRIR
jgi:hypothetical protein